MNKPPLYVRVQRTALRLVEGKSYYRDAGQWHVGFKLVGGQLVVNEPGQAHLHGQPLIEITQEEWAKDNGVLSEVEKAAQLTKIFEARARSALQQFVGKSVDSQTLAEVQQGLVKALLPVAPKVEVEVLPGGAKGEMCVFFRRPLEDS